MRENLPSVYAPAVGRGQVSRGPGRGQFSFPLSVEYSDVRRLALLRIVARLLHEHLLGHGRARRRVDAPAGLDPAGVGVLQPAEQPAGQRDLLADPGDHARHAAVFHAFT